MTIHFAAQRAELLAFVAGKTIAGLRPNTEDADAGFDILFADGSELELCAVGGSLVWAGLSAAEAAFYGAEAVAPLTYPTQPERIFIGAGEAQP